MDRRFFLASCATALAAQFHPTTALAGASRAPIGFIRSNWSRDPFSYGSYSFFAKGSSRRDARNLAKPVAGRLFFAGEATHPKYNSTVHAAYESGQIAARAIKRSGAQRIGIVGAGMSGLKAAESLVRLGKSVTLLEGRNRIGGRVWTDQQLGVPLDIGASWIHGQDGNPLTREAQQKGVETVRTVDSFVARGGDGRKVPDDELPDWLDEVMNIQHNAGAGYDDLNQLAYMSDADYGGHDVVFPGGYDQLFADMTDGVDLRLNWKARRVTYSDQSAQIENSEGEVVTFDALLLTVPLGVLKAERISFDPPLPKKKRAAINGLGMGVLDKVFLKYPEVFWDADVTWIATPENGLPHGQFNQWLNLYPYTGSPIIMAFNGGQPAKDLAGLSDRVIVDRAAQTLAEAYPT